ncbi:hypothetical protein LYZ86_11400 [Xanthomonas hortorum pv. cynarae]|uniref:hypothetical protein n=1 Tax=Xanthomonas hortorum TaxID=56454 RepID=UPI0011AFE8EB|nr:hypothetical protein [Xanthomonas hortorum]MCE4349867.1 hypothetical protein [Xanthomonas hortorum pv. cynarae]CAD0347855.1 hypothetical protein CFBP2044_33270 [Xanthomonas hortorum pv. cynarae]CAD0347859.1 hypothetical protein CFBP2044_33270 [Xanthomonas hortorum pv. cynarae]
MSIFRVLTHAAGNHQVRAERLKKRKVGEAAGKGSVGRGRDARTARGTRRKYFRVGSVVASMPPHGPAIGEDTAPDSLLIALLKPMHADQLDWSLPAHRRGTLRGMDAA